MATIQSITQGASYTGNAALGGAIDFGVTISPDPLNRLALFTYYRDRDMWAKRNQENKEAAKQIALLTAFDPNSPFKEYTEDLKKGITEVKDFIRNNPNALYFDRDPKGYQQVYEMIGNLDIKRKHATTNDVLWNAQKAAIEKIPNRKIRDAKMQLLENRGKGLFTNGIEDAYRQQLEAEPELKPQDYTVPTVPNVEKYTIKPHPNRIDITGIEVASIPRLYQMADAIYYGLENPLTKDSPELQGLSDAEKEERILEASITGYTKSQLDNMAATANELVNQYKATKGENVKVADIPAEALASDPTIGGLISLAKGLNETIDKINAATGEKNPHINLDDGINAREIIALQTFGKNPNAFYNEIKPQVIETDDEIQRANLGAEWARIGLARDQLNKAKIEDLSGADAILRQMAAVINKAEDDATQITESLGTTKIIAPKEYRIADLNTLQSFAKVDKDGNVTNVPDEVRYVKKDGQLKIIYYKKKVEDGQTSLEVDNKGNPIEDTTKTQKMDEREWVAQKVRQFFPNKDIGGVNALISEALIKNNNSLWSIAQLYRNPGAQAQAPNVTRVTETTIGGGGGGSVSAGSRGGGKTYTLNGKSYSQSDVEAAAKASNMTVEQYIQKAGLK